MNTAVTLTTSWQYFTADLGGTVGGTVTELSVLFFFTPVGTASTNDYFEIQEIQLVATTDSNVDVGDYPWRSIEEELQLCLPYYEKSFPYATAPAQNTGSAGGAAFWMQQLAATSTDWRQIVYTVRKRSTTPTITFYNPNAANAQIRNTTGSTDWTGMTTSTLSDVSVLVTGSSPGGSAAGNTTAVHWTADAEL